MGLIGAGASVDLSPLDEVNQVVRESPALMANYQKIRTRQTRERIRARLKAPQDLPALPFVWSYDPAAQARARRWYFANMVPKGSKGGRYQRTGKMEEATNVRFVTDDLGGYFLVENDADGASFVLGERQVPSHYATGWQRIDEVVEQEAALMSDQLVEDWYFVSTGQGR